MLKKNHLNNMIAIMPMAGQGKRFYNYGYKAPKHLIQINNKPMLKEPQ